MVLLSVKPQPILVQLLACKLSLLHDLLDLSFGQAKQNVFWLQISMDDPANSIQKVQPHKHLPCNLLDQIQRQSFVIVPFEHFKQVDSQDLKHHAKMITIGSFVKERVEEVEHMAVISIVLLLVGLVVLQRFDPIRMISVAGDFL